MTLLFTKIIVTSKYKILNEIKGSSIPHHQGGKFYYSQHTPADLTIDRIVRDQLCEMIKKIRIYK